MSIGFAATVQAPKGVTFSGGTRGRGTNHDKCDHGRAPARYVVPEIIEEASLPIAFESPTNATRAAATFEGGLSMSEQHAPTARGERAHK